VGDDEVKDTRHTLLRPQPKTFSADQKLVNPSTMCVEKVAHCFEIRYTAFVIDCCTRSNK